MVEELDYMSPFSSSLLMQQKEKGFIDKVTTSILTLPNLCNSQSNPCS